MSRRVSCLLLCGALTAGCGAGVSMPPDDSGTSDVGPADAGRVSDDASRDGGLDARSDGGATDASDAAPDDATDAGSNDTGSNDTGSNDTGSQDASVTDAPPDLPDVSLADAGIAPCSAGWSLCGDTCRDLASDSQACGTCDRDCHGAHAFGAVCAASTCSITACDVGYADVNHLADDGCEAQQDFSIALDAPTVVVSAGGTASVGVRIVRQNGFPYGISLTLTGGPSTLDVTPVSLTPDDRAVIAIHAVPLAAPGTYAVQVAAGATVAGVPFDHALPLTVQIVSSPVHVTSVELLRGGVALPQGQAPQGVGLLTLRVHGTGLLSAISAGLGTLSLTDVPGATDTQRDYEFGVPHGIDVGLGARPLDLVLHVVGGAPAETFANAVTLTDLHVDPGGNDVSGIGSWASPVQSIDRAFALAAAGDTVSLSSATHSPAATSAPAGLVAVRGGGGQILCTASAPIGLHAASSLAVYDTRLHGCDTALRVDDGTAGPVRLEGGVVETCVHPFDIASATQLDVVRSNLSGSAGSAMRFTSGRVSFVASTLSNFTVEAAGARLSIDGSQLIQGSGDAVIIGPSVDASAITGTLLVATTGDAIHVSPAAHLDITLSDAVSSRRGLVIDGGVVTTDVFFAHDDTELGILLTGDHPSLILAAFSHATMASGAYRNGGPGLRVAPTTGTATLQLSAFVAEGNAGGIDVQNAAGTTTAISMPSCVLRDNDGFDLRIAGGTTTIAAGSVLDAHVRAPLDVLVQLVSGAGTLSFTSGTWTLPQGTGISIEGASQHTVALGASARSLTIDLTGHPYDGHFGIVDDRGTPGGTATSARVRFVGSDGAVRTWSGVYTNTGSYSVSVSPRDLASWLVAHASRIDFGAP